MELSKEWSGYLRHRYLNEVKVLTNVLPWWVETVLRKEDPKDPSGVKVDVQPNGVEHLVNERTK